jgi:hypothetical protein
MGTVIHVVDLPDYEEHLRSLKSKMRAQEFDSACAEGASMSAEEVYEFAMQ